jgi:hypothetical protein
MTDSNAEKPPQCLECCGSGKIYHGRGRITCPRCRGTGHVQPPRPGYAPGVRWVVTGPDDQNGGSVAAVKGGLGQALLTAVVQAYNDAQEWTPGNWKIDFETCEVWIGDQK